MFGSTPVKSGLTFGKVLGGISKTLSVANQIIPLYQQAKPMISNAKTILGVLKDFGKNNTKSSSNSKENITTTSTSTKQETIVTEPNITNSPTFFQ